MYPDSSKNLNKETKDAVYFFTPVFYPLDNFSAHAVYVWGITFPTAEHAFHWKNMVGNIWMKIRDRVSVDYSN